MSKRTRIVIAALFAAYLASLMLYSIGNDPGIDGSNGFALLLSPGGIVGAALLAFGITSKNAGYWPALIGAVLLAAAEIYYFLTWHIVPITGHFDIAYSFQTAHAGFYISLILAAVMSAFCALAVRNKSASAAAEPRGCTR